MFSFVEPGARVPAVSSVYLSFPVGRNASGSCRVFDPDVGMFALQSHPRRIRQAYLSFRGALRIKGRYASQLLRGRGPGAFRIKQLELYPRRPPYQRASAFDFVAAGARVPRPGCLPHQPCVRRIKERGRRVTVYPARCQ
jgi:hypothetical protein